MFCSTIIPTIGRSELDRAVTSVLEQDFSAEPHEIIVVNDSGTLLPDAPWHGYDNVTILNTNRYERCVARNTGATVAQGRYLHFLDDDDWLEQGALQALWELSQQCNAAWLYGYTTLVTRDGTPIMTLKYGLDGRRGFVSTMAGELIPLQSSLIRSDAFHRVEGFDPTIVGPENIDLARRVLLYETLAETPQLISCVERGDLGSTTDVDRLGALLHRSRENVLTRSGVWRALRVSADNRPYWHGRIIILYLGSAAWNVRHRLFLTALGRAGFAGLSAVASLRYAVSRDFWRALIRPFRSPTFTQASRHHG
ncbi:MAG: glycosyltransferase family 2 protein [Anaerolineae bacterium]|nr:glycosyltransferase family 2 protein [Anaerolineae bacterium]